MHDRDVTIASLYRKDRRPALDLGIPLIGRDLVQRGESLAEMAAALLDGAQSR